MHVVRGTDLEYVAASHEDAQRPGVFKRVLATKNDLLEGRVQMVNWARLPIGSAFRPHYHEDMEEVFIIVRGRVAMRVGLITEELGPGDAVFVQPGEIHEMRNVSDIDAEYVVFGISTEQGGKTIVVT